MSITDIQSMELKILEDFHDFCMEKGLVYSLYGGTMIGAIRHEGFIPWDDDLDVAMPRQDYDRMIKEFHSDKGYQLHCLEHGNSLLAFARICEMKETYVKQSLPWCLHETGVYIDVFPLDGAPDDPQEAEKYEQQLHRKWMCVKLNRVSMRKTGDYKKQKTKFNIMVRKMLFRNPISKQIDWLNRLDKACRAIPFGSTGHFINASFGEYGMKEYQLTEDFTHTVMKKFMGKEFCICNGYDRLMKTKYGNYMEMPPANQRRMKHRGSKYFWKDDSIG